MNDRIYYNRSEAQELLSLLIYLENAESNTLLSEHIEKLTQKLEEKKNES